MSRYDFSNLGEPITSRAGRGRKRQGRRESERRMNRFLFLLFCVGALALGVAYFTGGYALDAQPAPAEAASSSSEVSVKRSLAGPVGTLTPDSPPLDREVSQRPPQTVSQHLVLRDMEEPEDWGGQRYLENLDNPEGLVEVAQATIKPESKATQSKTQVQPRDGSQPKDSAKGSKTKTPAASKGRWILIDKSSYTLTLYNGDKPEKTYKVAVGKNPGDKQKVGDNRTPIGEFTVQSIENASHWTHDFKDGKGVIAGAYGPWFIRLKTGKWRGIGIHGTHNPASIGTMATEGCIRLQNENLRELKPLVRVGMRVRIQE